MGSKGAVLYHTRSGTVVLQCTDAAAAETGIAVGGIGVVGRVPHKTFALHRTGRAAERGPPVAVSVGTLGCAGVGIGNDKVLAALVKGGHRDGYGSAVCRQRAESGSGRVQGEADRAVVDEGDLARRDRRRTGPQRRAASGRGIAAATTTPHKHSHEQNACSYR